MNARLSLYTKVVYGLGDIPNAVKTILAGIFGFYFYTSVMGMAGTLVGLAAVIGLVWDALIDPFIGHLSDRSRSRFGRRHGFMLVGALTMGLGFWASFSPPAGLSNAGLFAWLLATGFVVRTATSVYRVPYLALGAELSSDYDERTSITGLRGIVGMLGAFVAAGSVFVLFFPNRTPGVDPKLDHDGYWAMGLAVGLTMTVVGVITTMGTFDRRSAPGVRTVVESARRRWDFVADALQSVSSPSFRVLLASASLFSLAVAINAALSIHFLTHYVKLTDSRLLSVLQVVFFVGVAAGLLVWLRLSRVAEKHRLYAIGTLGTAAALIVAFVLLRDGGSLPAIAIVQLLGGFFGSVVWFLPATMIADVVDEDELARGSRREGSFFGCFSLGQQLALGLSLLLTGLLLDGFAGLVPGEATQSATTELRIGMLYCLLPALLLIVAGLLALRYGLGRREVRRIQAELLAASGDAR